MQNRQENRLNMYLAVRDYLLQNQEITKGLPNFTSNFAELQKTITEIQAISEVQRSNIKGFARQKRDLGVRLIALILDNSHKISAYATFGNNQMLKSKVKVTTTTLHRSTDTGLRDHAQILYNEISENLAALKDYGISEETQADFQKTIDEYNASISGPRVAKTETVRATRQMETFFDRADTLVANIDTAIGIIKIKQPDFLNGFNTAKKVISSGTGSLALKALATDSGTGEPLQGAKFTFSPVASELKGVPMQEEIVKTTASKGIFNIKNMQYGTYKVRVTKPGYKEKVTDIVVAAEKMTELRVELEAV
jgi:hypothetical protein